MPDITGQQALDVAIGLILVFFLLSVVCSAINEAFATALAWRSETLLAGLRSLLADASEPPSRPRQTRKGQATDPKAAAGPPAVETRDPRQPTLSAILDHPLVRSLVDETARRKIRREVPSYLPSRTFATALLDTVAPDVVRKLNEQRGPEAGPLESHDVMREVGESVRVIENHQIRTVLEALVDDAREDIDRFREGIEQWFDATMERVSGWYKRHVQLRLWLIAFLVAFGLNADAFQIGNQLWKDDALRAAVVAQAQKTVDEGDTSDIDGAGGGGGDSNGKTVSESVEDVEELSLPIGWSLDPDDPRWPDDFWGFAGKLSGLLVTWIALTMGAPFWFDLLGRVSRVRGTGSKPAAEAK
jgi:hypothetical protein